MPAIWFLSIENVNRTVLGEEVKIILKKRIDTTTSSISLLKDSLLSLDFLLKYYKENDCNPVWIGQSGELSIADSLINKIKESVFDGLNPFDYHLTTIETLREELLKCKREGSTFINKWTDLEILLSDAFITYALHEYAGCSYSREYNIDRKKHIAFISVIDSLKEATEKNRIRETISNFSCTHPQYQELKLLLKKYIDLSKNGGWPLLPKDTRLKSGDKNIKVITLRKCLLITGDLIETKAGIDSLFDSTLVKAVIKFQQRHGLKDNGIIDLETLNEMNIPIENRIKQIALNMERWRWLPRFIEQPYILVNIAGFKLYVIENDQTIMDMKIIVGKFSHRTPVFHADMTYLILNPWWEIPKSIVLKEILPEIKKDTSYLTRNNIKIYKNWKQEVKPVPVDSMDWGLIDSCNFNYRLRQTPGPWNAMGQIKFMLPNKYNIYLHDTPNKELFSKRVRTFSHGCIRIEKPIELASYLLRNDTSWERDRLLRGIDSKKEQTIVLSIPTKVYICYFTTWVDRKGLPYFGRDIYMYNKELEKRLSYLY